MKAGTTFPPVVIFQDDDAYYLADGFHRYEAARLCGLDSIDVEVRTSLCVDGVEETGRRAALLYSSGANDRHGLRRSNVDKRKAVETQLIDVKWNSRSDRWIARAANVSNTLSVVSMAWIKCGTALTDPMSASFSAAATRIASSSDSNFQMYHCSRIAGFNADPAATSTPMLRTATAQTTVFLFGRFMSSLYRRHVARLPALPGVAGVVSSGIRRLRDTSFPRPWCPPQ